MQILGIIPARGGSKGIIHKNLTPLGGKALIDWTIEVALQSKLTEVIVTSDCRMTLAHAHSKGAGTIVRPNNLSTDEAEMLPVIKHATATYIRQSGNIPDAICLLQD